ncbi:MAG: DUF6290 family protein [Deinococcaceae bacterium]
MSTSVRLSEEMERRLNQLSERTGRSKAYYIREAIGEHLDDLEDAYLAEAVLSRIRRGEERLWNLEDVEKHLGLAD